MITIFKFHYVSINSNLKDSGVSRTLNFKFHYVSINSQIDFYNFNHVKIL